MICRPVVTVDRGEDAAVLASLKFAFQNDRNYINFYPPKHKNTKDNVNHVRAALNLVVPLLQNIKGRRRGIDSNCRRSTSSL